MGMSDIPPPTTSCLKRCRSEDPSSLAELYPPPLKQPFTHSSPHLSILQDLESSLNAVPTVEAAPTPEELVTEMMQSLEKVMGDIGERIPGSSDPYTCAIDNSKLCVGNSPQAHEFYACGDQSSPFIGTVDTVSDASEALNLCRDTAEDCEESELACDYVHPKATLDGINCRGMASNCDIASAYGACRGDVNNGSIVMGATSEHVCAEGCATDGCIGGDSIQHLLETSDSELGVVHGTDETASTPPTEQTDEQWNLLDELTDSFAFSALPSQHISWLEEGCDLPAFTLSQIEEEGFLSVARENTESLLLDCYI